MRWRSEKIFYITYNIFFTFQGMTEALGNLNQIVEDLTSSMLFVSFVLRFSLTGMCCFPSNIGCHDIGFNYVKPFDLVCKFFKGLYFISTTNCP